MYKFGALVDVDHCRRRYVPRLYCPRYSVLFDLIHLLDNPYAGGRALLSDESEPLTVHGFEILACLTQGLHQNVVVEVNKVRVSFVYGQFSEGSFQSAQASVR
ncbi:hypothetical protein [Streptomyces antimicrobicus]|uniref:Uncharacterized protein n=1 Tax=Streptomyces antimicrobicus TaxID=2883108 RepID=A0ABS8BAS7_9ACTN|nr:hypothetical protein [Streptomyces antimicrobicus]MCB5181658.1 hypothetical protein [Streptomyces antimicrobicus]